MLDRLRISIPFKSKHVLGCRTYSDCNEALLFGHTGNVDLSTIHDSDLPMSAQIRFMGLDEEQKPDFAYFGLKHSFESLPSSFTAMAFKIFPEPNPHALTWPSVEIKASPAKILQGHNVYGSSDILNGAAEMLGQLKKARPEVYEMLDIHLAEVREIDCTYSVRAESEMVAQQTLDFFSKISNGQTKARGNGFKTTNYYGSKSSRLRKLKIYLKSPEFQTQLKEYERKAKTGCKSSQRIYDVMSNPSLIKFSQNLIRLEATLCHRWLERRQIPTNLLSLIRLQKTFKDDGKCLLQSFWTEAFKDLFKALEGASMAILDDDSVLQTLVNEYATFPYSVIETKKTKPYSDAKPKRLMHFFRSLRDYGYERMLADIPKATFHRNLSLLVSAGICKAQLQQFEGGTYASNIVPLLRIVHIDFQNQLPADFLEPQSQFAHYLSPIRKVA